MKRFRRFFEDREDQPETPRDAAMAYVRVVRARLERVEAALSGAGVNERDWRKALGDIIDASTSLDVIGQIVSDEVDRETDERLAMADHEDNQSF